MIDIYNIKCPACAKATIVYVEARRNIGYTCYCKGCHVKWVEDEKGIVEIGWHDQEKGTLAIGAKVRI